MRTVNKINLFLLLLSLMLGLAIFTVSQLNHPPFLDGKDNTLLFSHGVTFSSKGKQAYHELHTIDQYWHGLHSLHSTIAPENGTTSLKNFSSICFWSDSLFSLRNPQRNAAYTREKEPDATEAHLLDDQAEQFFQILYQDKVNFCHSSLLTGNVRCVTAEQ